MKIKKHKLKNMNITRVVPCKQNRRRFGIKFRAF